MESYMRDADAPYIKRFYLIEESKKSMKIEQIHPKGMDMDSYMMEEEINFDYSSIEEPRLANSKSY